MPDSLRDLLAEPFHHLGKPAPLRVAALRPPGALGHYLVEDRAGGSHRLTTVLSDLNGSGAYGPLLAARRLEGIASVPVQPAVAFPVHALGCAALLQGVPGGRPADWSGAPEPALAALGRVLDHLGQHPQMDRGVVASPYGFRPVADDWAGEWRWLCGRWAVLARRGGTAWQPLVDELLEEVHRAPLPLDEAPVLVPPGLEPGALWLDDAGSVRAVDGWTGAWCGDRWSAWAPLLHLPAQALATVRAAFEVPPTLAPQAPRLAAYAAGHVLRLLARAAAAGRPHERIAGVSRAMLAAEARRSLAPRLAAADAGEVGPSTVAPERRPVLAVMDRLVREPAVVDRESWLATAGAVLMAHGLVGADGMDGWARVAERALASLEAGAAPAPLDGGPLGAAPTGAGGLPPAEATAERLIVRWVGASLREAAGGWAPEGYEAALHQLGGIPAGSRAGPADRLARALLTLAAAHRLGQAVGSLPVAEQVQAAADAWEALDFGTRREGVPLAQVLQRYAEPEAHAGMAQPVALLLFALGRGGELPLPAEPPALLQAMGIEVR